MDGESHKSLTFQRETYDQVIGEIRPTLERHYEEIAENKEVIGPLDPDYSLYERADKAGKLGVLTARMNGKLVGYYVAFIGQNLHYKTIIVATEDIYYLAPEYRQGSLGIRLFIEAEKMMREFGAVISIAKMKKAHDHSVIFERLGYKPFEQVFIKILNGGR